MFKYLGVYLLFLVGTAICIWFLTPHDWCYFIAKWFIISVVTFAFLMVAIEYLRPRPEPKNVLTPNFSE